MAEKKYLKLSDIEAYRISFHVSNHAWNVVMRWNRFAQETVGMQFVRAVDSISANIAEGFGRKGKRDKTKFYNYYPGGKLKATGNYVNQKKDSVWNYYAENDSLIAREVYKSGLENGDWKIFYPNGKVSELTT